MFDPLVSRIVPIARNRGNAQIAICANADFRNLHHKNLQFAKEFALCETMRSQNRPQNANFSARSLQDEKTEPITGDVLNEGYYLHGAGRLPR